MLSVEIPPEKAPELEQNSGLVGYEEGNTEKDAVLDLVTTTDVNTDQNYPAGIKLAVIIASLAASVFLCALDETIITTAIPRITDEFKSINDVGWYGSAYFMTFASFQLIYGKLFTFYSIKSVFLASVFIFEVGSLICATAPTSSAFIAGRACAGLGSAGINAGFIIILAASLPLHRRPIFVSSYSGMYGVAAVVAPLLGGEFTTKATWRWCFYINLPIGGCTLLVMALFFHPQGRTEVKSTTTKEKIAQMDLLGTAVLIPAIVCLLLALQWGGSVHSWHSPPIIVLLVISAVALVGFVVIQIWKQDAATVPPRIIKQRSVLPIWFQAIQGVTAFESGVRILPTTMGTVVFSFVAGFGVFITGYYTPFMIIGAALLLTGASLVTTWKINSPAAQWIGYQIILSAGTGLGIQQAHTAAQTVLPAVDVPTGAVVLIFSQILGGTVWLSVAQNVLTSQLLKGLVGTVPGLDPNTVLSMGATGLRSVVRAQFLGDVLEVYNVALIRTFYCSIALAAIALIAASGMEWKSVKKKATV
ncbi:hypothetical protein B7463_g868, partial [Scytalidium lignicola]